jgi:transposase
MTSIPTETWQVNASDPLALTRLLNLPGFVVTSMEYDDHLDYLTVFCDHASDVAICPRCGTLSQHIHQYRCRRVRDLPLAGHICFVEFDGRRFKCPFCRSPFTESLPLIAPSARLTQRYASYVFELCRATTLQAVHQRERLGYKTVEALYYREAARRAASLLTAPVRRLGIDEIALKKGHDQYVLVLSDLERRCVITVLPDRSKESLEAYLATWTEEARAAVSEVALDLWQPYHLAVAALLPKARISADRFHVMKNLNDQVTAARREIQRAAPESEKAQLKGCRWLLVKNEENLTEAEQAKLALLGQVSPALKQLHSLKEDFRTIFESAPSRSTAAAELLKWIEQAEQSGLKQLAKFVTTLRNWWDVILNYFHDHLTSGFVEGMNNKLKVIKRSGFGYRNFEHFRLRVLMECGGSP